MVNAQEYLVEDMVEILTFLSMTVPSVLSNARLEDVLVFLVVFLGAPAYVANPYLRSKMVEVWSTRFISNLTSCLHWAACLPYLHGSHALVTGLIACWNSAGALHVDAAGTGRAASPTACLCLARIAARGPTSCDSSPGERCEEC